MSEEAMDMAKALVGDLNLPKGMDPVTFVQDVVDQVIKDFALDRNRLAASSISLVHLLADDIAEGLAGHRADEVFAAFYRLDLGEGLIRETLEAHDRQAAALTLARLSVQRAAMKVWSRWNYKSQTS